MFLVSAGASAQTNRAEIIEARQHFIDGEAAYKRGDWDKAIAEYQAAYDLSKRPLLLYNVAQSWRRKAEQGGAPEDRRKALESYRAYLDADPNGRGAADARTRIEELSRGLEPAPAPPPPEVEPVTPAAVEPTPPPAPPASPEDTGGSWRIAGIATAGAGVLLLAGGAYFGLRAKSKSDQVDDLQRGDMWDQDLYDSGKAAERNMFIFLGAGAAAVATGAVFYFVVGKPSPVAAAVVPTAGGVGLHVSGSF